MIQIDFTLRRYTKHEEVQHASHAYAMHADPEVDMVSLAQKDYQDSSKVCDSEDIQVMPTSESLETELDNFESVLIVHLSCFILSS